MLILSVVFLFCIRKLTTNLQSTALLQMRFLRTGSFYCIFQVGCPLLLEIGSQSQAPPISKSSTTNLELQGFAESLQHDSSNQSEIVMIKLYCCGPDYCAIYPLLYYFFQIRNDLGSSRLCCKDSAKSCTVLCFSHQLSIV